MKRLGVAELFGWFRPDPGAEAIWIRIGHRYVPGTACPTNGFGPASSTAHFSYDSTNGVVGGSLAGWQDVRLTKDLHDHHTPGAAVGPSERDRLSFGQPN